MLGCMDTPKEYVTTKCLTFVIRLQSLRSSLQYVGTSRRGTHNVSCSNVRIQTRGIEHYAPIWYNSVGLRKLILTKWTQGLMDQVRGMITHETRISCGFVTNIQTVGDLGNPCVGLRQVRYEEVPEGTQRGETTVLNKGSGYTQTWKSREQVDKL